MIPKQYRLKKNIEFVATYAQKKYISNSYFTLNLGKPKPFENYISKVAFVVSKKVDKRAVIRNKIKRRMREAYMLLIKKNPDYTKWMSMIYVAKQNSVDADFNTILSEMKSAMQKAGEKYE